MEQHLPKPAEAAASIFTPDGLLGLSRLSTFMDRELAARNLEATAADGTIEAVSVIDANGFAVGVQWHPEYWAETDAPSRALFEAFGKAVHDYRNSKA